MIKREKLHQVVTHALLLVLPLIGVTQESDVYTSTLEGGISLRQKGIEPTRSTPHAFVDQGLASVAAIGDRQVLMSRRLGDLGGNGDLQYSLLVTSGKSGSPEVTISGEVRAGSVAWSYQVIADMKNWQESVLVVVEELSRQAFIRSRPPGEFRMSDYAYGSYNLLDALNRPRNGQEQMARKATEALSRGRTSTARDAVNLATRALFAHEVGLDARESVRVMGLYYLTRDVPGFAVKDDLVWEVRTVFSYQHRSVSGVVWVSASTGETKVLFPW